jgi:hypothetical protein
VVYARSRLSRDFQVTGASPPSQPLFFRGNEQLHFYPSRITNHLRRITNHELRIPYSYLNAIIGSTLVARRAGIKLAIKATAPSRIEMPANVNGS